MRRRDSSAAVEAAPPAVAPVDGHPCETVRLRLPHGSKHVNTSHESLLSSRYLGKERRGFSRRRRPRRQRRRASRGRQSARGQTLSPAGWPCSRASASRRPCTRARPPCAFVANAATCMCSMIPWLDPAWPRPRTDCRPILRVVLRSRGWEDEPGHGAGARGGKRMCHMRAWGAHGRYACMGRGAARVVRVYWIRHGQGFVADVAAGAADVGSGVRHGGGRLPLQPQHAGVHRPGSDCLHARAGRLARSERWGC